jgi:hypothetical protein
MIVISKLSDTKLPFVSGYVFSHIVNIHTSEYYCFVEENEFKNRFVKIPGQISPESSLGSMLTSYASQGIYNHWVEIGSWNGLGSTLCILDGFKKTLETKPKLLSFELDPVMFNVANENLKNHEAFSCVTFLNNKLDSENLEFPSEEEIPVEEKKSAHYMLHFEREKTLWNLARGVSLPFSPDAVVLDGGEYSGYLDWLSIDKTNLKLIFLDDTNCYKNKKVVEELDTNSEWNCVKKSSERNGFAVYEKIRVT